VFDQAVVLAGGRGTRLASRLGGRPKALIDVAGVPLLERQLCSLKAQGLASAFVLVGHEAAQIEAFCAARDNFGLDLTLVDDGEPRGTAGAVLAILDRLGPEFLVVYGDTLFDIDMARFARVHRADSTAVATLFLHPNDHPHDSDIVELDGTGAIQAFHAPPHAPGVWLPNMVNAALYALRRERLAAWRPPIGARQLDFARDVFPGLLAAGARLRGYVSPEYIKDIGAPERLDRACAALAVGEVAAASLRAPRPAIFLDRDGTLNVPNGHIARPEDLHLYPWACEAVRGVNRSPYRAVLVTNQPVIARGECGPAELRTIHAKLETLLGREGAWLDGLYVCPHHPDAGFPGEVASLKIACECRKPRPGLLLRAAADLNIDLPRSWMIGDSAADMDAARAVGVGALLVRSSGATNGPPTPNADFVFDDALAAVKFATRAAPRVGAGANS
jgi:histidinol-phosphate phosphatase family protein